MPGLEELKAHVGEGNGHLVQFWEQLDAEEQSRFKTQLESISFPECAAAFTRSAEQSAPAEEEIAPVPDSNYVAAKNIPDDEKKRLARLGLEAISRGQVAVLVLAGGQASRLGANQPKGTLPLGLGLTTNDSLLCLQGAKIARLEKLAKEEFPESKPLIQWVVMTSESTEAETREHIDKVVRVNGLTAAQVSMFSQAEMPAFTMEGKPLLAERGRLSTAPNGNGGVYSALAPRLPSLEDHGVRYVHVYCVDNILCKVADPLMLGIFIDRDVECMAKAVTRSDPKEKVGVVCHLKGLPAVVEYSELGEKLASSKNADGSLEYRAGNIANHVYTLDFLKRCSTAQLPYHRAHKKIPFVNGDGTKVSPTSPNGIKLELFVFDVFYMSGARFACYEVDREEEFSPLKNPDSEGKECLATCRRDVERLHSGWLVAAGAEADPSCRVSPALSYDGEGLGHCKGKTLSGVIIG